MKLISILMPVYNVKEYIGEAIESILNQTYKNFELIIIDDASSDGTTLMIESYAKKDSRIIHLKNQKNEKIVSSLNKGLDRAKGDYICRMDGDDISELDRLEKKIDYMERNPEIDILGCSVYTINQNGIVLGKNTLLEDFKTIKKTIKYSSPILHIWMAKKEVYDTVGKYRNISYVEDYDFLLRSIKHGFILSNLEDYYGYRVRIREGNTQSTAGIYQRKAHRYCYDLYLKEKTGEDLFSESKFKKAIESTEKEIKKYMTSSDFLLRAIAEKNKIKKMYLLTRAYCSSSEQRKYLNRRILYRLKT
ncbi:Chondroitin polymerase [Acholeplasma oculi]|nr:glycosyltransferase family 2 protein [Acholeplasma oculi]SKC48056.1 Glycosyl transferase family 2 [Acholeplasma oculi]SUT89119.1 Chondroitin polymerase [Acholeplasma oculi]